ncbi:Uncharacterised protein [Neisseria meningitidis]|nr:Uncharacterised protein [Neisseria meningitidis]
MHTVFRLIEHDAGGAFEYFFCNFHTVQPEGFVNPFADFGFAVVEGGQAVHEFDLRIARCRHQFGRNAVIFQQIDAFLPDFFRLAHADPHIGMNKINILHGFMRVFGQGNFCAGFFGGGVCGGNNAFRRPQALRCADTHVHPQFCP